MMEITAIGLGFMMTAVAAAFAGLMLEATLLMMGKALRDPLAAQLRLPHPFELGEQHEAPVFLSEWPIANADAISANALQMIDQGRQIFRFDTFGHELSGVTLSSRIRPFRARGSEASVQA